jgi:4-amino-4-deoxy-L-arabinose transferase-like glycosyltransferase
MLTNYIVGAWLSARGYDVRSLAVRWYEVVLLPSGPDTTPPRLVMDALLLARAREPMVLFGTGVIILVYLLGRALGGVVAGLLAALLALGSPLSREYFVVARPEAPLMFFTFLGLLLGVRGARQDHAGGLPIRWSVGLGVVLGLALASKLTAAFALAAVAGWGVLMAACACGRPSPSSLGGFVQRAWQVWRGWGLALAVAAGVFVLSNPHLYQGPLLHTAHLFQYRTAELARQRIQFPQRMVDSPPDRAGRVLRESLIRQTATGSRRVPLEAVLAVIGFSGLMVRFGQQWWREGRPPPEGLLLLSALAHFAGTAAGLQIAWVRYFLPTQLLGALFSGLGMAVVVERAWALAARWRRAEAKVDSGQPRKGFN